MGIKTLDPRIQMELVAAKRYCVGNKPIQENAAESHRSLMRIRDEVIDIKKLAPSKAMAATKTRDRPHFSRTLDENQSKSIFPSLHANRFEELQLG